MKNNKIIKSLDKIAPTKDEKSIMLKNILNSNNKRKLNYLYFVRFSTCLVIMLILVGTNPFNLKDIDKNNSRVMRNTFTINNFCYDNKCYIATDYKIGRHDLGKYLFTIKDKNSQLNGKNVYQYKDGSLAIDTGNSYQIYKLYEEEK
jgi:hypothetical protein